MRHVLAIAKREVRAYLVSPITYAAVGGFVLLSGYFFNSVVVYYNRIATLADAEAQRAGLPAAALDVPTLVLEQFFKTEGTIVLLLVVPLLTMGLLAEERRKGTIELLLTSPVRPAELALGKFLAALAIAAVMCASTVPHFSVLARAGVWEPGVMLAGYTGMFLLVAAEIAIGLFISSLCESVVVSVLATYGVLVALTYLDSSFPLGQALWNDFIQFLSFDTHVAEFARGVIALSDVIYFVSALVLGLFLTQRAIESMRFRRS
jgi:ABC-2 type transport system permease protein